MESKERLAEIRNWWTANADAKEDVSFLLYVIEQLETEQLDDYCLGFADGVNNAYAQWQETGKVTPLLMVVVEREKE